MKSDTFNHADIYDVIIVGAGISGINIAHHLKTKLPDLTYAILEGRNSIGGTWDFFRYPGLRSDTDLFTFGYSWNLWTEKRIIADGDSIKRYLWTTAEKDGIDKHIRLQHHVHSANWISRNQLWDVITQTPSGTVSFHARFVVLGTGYYDYKEPLPAVIPGLDQKFKGAIVHPQFWPEDLDYTGKDIVIIGSGATAITLLPSLARRAGHVTMLQRSPAYIIPEDNSTGQSLVYKMLPVAWSSKLWRLFFMWRTLLLFHFCRIFPRWARSQLLKGVANQLPPDVPMNPHFEPTYRPWDQRPCFTPNADFFEPMRQGKAAVVTGRIQTVTESAIILDSGEHLTADIIVTATGIKLSLGGHIKFNIDGTHVDLADRYAWNAALLQNIPNMAFVIGYVNASWTLGAEVTAHRICRLLKHMQNRGYTVAIPRMPVNLRVRPSMLWNLDATYAKEAARSMPICGDSGPWVGRTNYFRDLWSAQHGDISKHVEFLTEEDQ
ncbi:FAD/NAD(P)-binding domain-containing protein [Coniochaeta ligniaria NRRL 30616]|uniref:FAD/NAD(P)-binding domain-containing protein n=1 Tax=Coniochaeta ligniaria NRRL 30616 TaxID=1408157 RepID=A0A1J7JQN8_9PEZI|nr:FAD/NAD(P)-binding domain-containing protein [Coniochaeta ligniaria NRRL 30616]